MLGQLRTCGWGLVILALVATATATSAEAAHLGMGFRVGEVTQTSAVVWTRITKTNDRNQNGHREPQKREPRQDEYLPSKVPVADREGEIEGAAGQVRVVYVPKGGARGGNAIPHTPWRTAEKDNDYVVQFQLADLKPATEYELKVEASDSADAETTATATGTFRTAAEKDAWQDVTFTVITGQAYWDLDDKRGYHIYPAMQKLNPQFLIPTGDTVYMDSEAPRARTVELARYHWHRMYSLPRHIEFHRSVPGYWEVDDHDSWCNDCWPTMRARWMNPLTFDEGFAVYREQVPMGEQTYRTVRWGQGLQVWMVEGRLYRSPNNMPDGPDKTIWGKEQLEWLKRTIQESDADFRVLISPTPIVGPDRPKGKNDNHSNDSFAHEGNHFRDWTQEQKLENFFVCCGDRHWQYLSIDPKTKLHEFSCGPASDIHSGGSPGRDPEMQPFHRVKGGFLSVSVTKEDGTPTIAFRHHDVHGEVTNEFKSTSSR